MSKKIKFTANGVSPFPPGGFTYFHEAPLEKQVTDRFNEIKMPAQFFQIAGAASAFFHGHLLIVRSFVENGEDKREVWLDPRKPE